MHLVGCTIRIYYDAPAYGRQIDIDVNGVPYDLTFNALHVTSLFKFRMVLA